jgi:hypothetical protein
LSEALSYDLPKCLLKPLVILTGTPGWPFGSSSAPANLLPDVPVHQQSINILV